MAIIRNDKTTKGLFMVNAIDNFGNDVELFFETHIEAQAIANAELQNQVKYLDEFKVIDGRKQHPLGLSFRDWLKNRKDLDKAMNEMECWLVERHLKNCEKCRKFAKELIIK